jgi:hypothetical protein
MQVELLDLPVAGYREAEIQDLWPCVRVVVGGPLVKPPVVQGAGRGAIRMKAICLKQPWAELVASGKKTIETRGWRTGYRGPLLVVASRIPDRGAMTLHQRELRGKLREQSGLRFGAAVAVVQLVRIERLSGTPIEQRAACCPCAGKWGWFLEGAVRIDPFPVRGMPGLFEVDCPAAP